MTTTDNAIRRALEALTEWGCTYTGPNDPNSPHALLIAARAALDAEPTHAALLARCESFIAGFEGDELQDGLPDALLVDLRAVIGARPMAGPFYVMAGEKSCAECATTEEARTRGRELADAEPLPCSFWIADSEGDHLEDIARTDGAELPELVKRFNAKHGEDSAERAERLRQEAKFSPPRG